MNSPTFHLSTEEHPGRIDFDLRALVEESTRLLAEPAHGKALDLAVRITREVPTALRGAPARLREILVKLLDNAIMTSEKDEVVVKVEVEEESEEGACLNFSLWDTDIGCEGSDGLGKDSGGRSRFGFSARFEKNRSGDEVQELPPRELRGIRALVVDDSATNRSILEDFLEDWGIENRSASCGRKGFETLHSANRKNRPFDLILLDMQMPCISGSEMVRLIRGNPAFDGMRIIMMTPAGFAGPIEDGGIQACLRKPVCRTELYECLSSAMEDPLHPPSMAH